MKNYYEILEVDIHASKEVIDKAFKVLAKKYHPDTQEDENKKEWAEEQFKLLNEAYEVLSNEAKRDEYTKELEFDKNNELNALLLKNTNLEIQIEDLKVQLQSFQNASTNHQQLPYENKTDFENNSSRQTFSPYDAQVQYTTPKQTYTKQPTYYESYYHPIKSKFKSFVAFCITIFIMAFIGFLIWKIPYTHNLLVKFYESNSVLKSIFSLFYK